MAVTTSPETSTAPLVSNTAQGIGSDDTQRVPTILDNGANYERPRVDRAPFLDNQIERGLLRLEFLLRRGVNAVSRGLDPGNRPSSYDVQDCQLGCARGGGGRGRFARRRNAQRSSAFEYSFPPLDFGGEFAAQPSFASATLIPGTDADTTLPTSPAPVPLPPAAPLMLVGFAGLFWLRRRKS